MLDGKLLTFAGNKVQVEKGKTVLFTAVTDAGYRVKEWTGLKDVGTASIVTLTVTIAVQVPAEFINVPE